MARFSGRPGPARAPFGTLPSPKNDTARGGVRIVVVAERRPFFHRLRVTDFSPPSSAINSSRSSRQQGSRGKGQRFLGRSTGGGCCAFCATHVRVWCDAPQPRSRGDAEHRSALLPFVSLSSRCPPKPLLALAHVRADSSAQRAELAERRCTGRGGVHSQAHSLARQALAYARLHRGPRGQVHSGTTPAGEVKLRARAG